MAMGSVNPQMNLLSTAGMDRDLSATRDNLKSWQ